MQEVRKTVADFINAGHVIFNEEHLEAIDNGISALKTLADMPAYWQVSMTLTEDELKQLMKTKMDSVYGQTVSTYQDTDSVISKDNYYHALATGEERQETTK